MIFLSGDPYQAVASLKKLPCCPLTFLVSLKLLILHWISICLFPGLLPGLCHRDSFTFLPYMDSVLQPRIGPMSCPYLSHSHFYLWCPPTCSHQSQALSSKPNLKLLCRVPSKGSGKDMGFQPQPQPQPQGFPSSVYATWSVFISSHVILQQFLWMFFSHLDKKPLATPLPHLGRVQAFLFLLQLAWVFVTSRCCSGKV